jgi:hypothetical protein
MTQVNDVAPGPLVSTVTLANPRTMILTNFNLHYISRNYHVHLSLSDSRVFEKRVFTRAHPMFASEFPLPSDGLYKCWLKIACWFWRKFFFKTLFPISTYLEQFSLLWSHLSQKKIIWTRVNFYMSDWLIIYSFTSRSRIFHLYGDVTIAVEGLQNLSLCSALRAFEQGGIFIVPHLLRHGTSVFFGFIRKTAPFSRLLRHTRGCGGSILTRILSGFTCQKVLM